MTSLVKVGLPSHLAAGARFAKRAQQLLDQAAAAHARADTELAARFKVLVTETEHEVSAGVAAAEDVPAVQQAS